MQEIKIKVRGREYTLNNNSDKYDRAKKDAGENATPEKILAHYDKLGGLIKDEDGNKIENGLFWQKEREHLVKKIVSDLDERERFREDFLKYLREEKSNYARLVLQENLISYNVISLLIFIQSIINLDCISNSHLFETKIWIKLSSKKLQKETLGKLIHFLSVFLNDSMLVSDLENFNSMRNDITHKALHKYRKFNELHNDSKKVTILGEKIINNLETTMKNIANLSKESMIKEIKATDLIRDSRILINENFKKLEARLRKIEKRLKKSKKK
ncbi:MAG: hypothetical protein HYW15_03420 [Candidatus Giovannonibacteria bacterium]|nr:MAG: hypothetical protein HYW15_03420 [Candidatus Giovannonibacteria bacterium]